MIGMPSKCQHYYSRHFTCFTQVVDARINIPLKFYSKPDILVQVEDTAWRACPNQPIHAMLQRYQQHMHGNIYTPT